MQQALISFREANWLPDRSAVNYIFDFSYLNTDLTPPLLIAKASVEVSFPPDHPASKYQLLQIKAKEVVLARILSDWQVDATGTTVEFV